MKQVWQKLFLITVPLTTLGSLAPLTSVKAQITPDNSLGAERSVVNANLTIRGIPSDRIDGGARRGRNLFHSFQEFNVGAGRGAYFSNPTGVDNILTRVTGSNPSNILGRLGVLGNANLFLLNPNGIIFGQNASLDVRGSFLASTASSIIFNNGFEFSATNPQAPPLLTVNVPIGLQFGNNPGSITVNGFGQPQGINGTSSVENPTLAVDAGQTLALVGGNVSLDGGVLQASGGLVELGGLTAAGRVGINSDNSLIFPNGVERASVSLQNSSNIDVSGSGSGSIAINARNLDLQHSSLTADIRSSSDTPSLRAGDITVNATETITLAQSSQIESRVLSNATNDGGNINITTGSLSIRNGSEVNTLTFGQANTGNVNINARDTVSFDGAIPGFPSGIVSVALSQSTGNAGNININTGTLSLTNGARVLTFSNGQGSAGSVTINARDRVSLDGTQSDETRSGVYTFNNSPNSIGNNGGISITTGTLSITNDAQLNTSTSGMGNAGDVTIVALSLSLNNGSVFTSVNPTAIGNGGDISITSGDISLANGAQLSASSLGMGNAGNINITTKNAISLDAGSTVSSTLGASTARRVSVRLENNRPIVTLEPLEQTVFQNAQGNSGNINIRTNRLAVTNGARLTTSTSGQGNAGNIIVNTNTTTFSGSTPNGSPGGASSAVETRAVGKGGIININTDELTVDNGAQLVAGTFGTGDAGSINITARDTVSFNGVSSNGSPSGAFSAVDAKAVGNGGNLTVDAKRLNILHGAVGNVSNLGSGNRNAGNLQVRADLINLDFGKLIADSTSGNGGNIALQVNDILLLRNNSLISNTSGTAQAGGNGGNFRLSTKFLVAPAFENNDIFTNAFNGRGGNININAFKIFGFVIRSREDLVRLRPNDLDPRQLTTNDISAVSQTGPSFVILNQEDFSRVSVMPTTVDVSNRLITPSCTAFTNSGGSSFTVTGRGGLPTSPDEPLTSDAVWTDTRLPVTTAQHQHKTHAAKPKPQPISIIPATGWVVNDKGEVTLISSVSNPTSLNTPTNCPAK